MEFNPFDMASFRQYYAEQMRHEQGAQPPVDIGCDTAPEGPDKTPDLLQPLGALRAGRLPQESPAGDRGMGPRTEALPGAAQPRRARNTARVYEQVVDSRLRIECARAPKQQRTPEATVRQMMNDVLEGVERGERLTEHMANLPDDVAVFFRRNGETRFGVKRGLSEVGLEWLNQQEGGAALVTRFERAFENPSVWQFSPAPRQADPFPEDEMRRGLMRVHRDLKRGRTLEEALAGAPESIAVNFMRGGRSGMSAVVRELLKSYGDEVVKDFEAAVAQFRRRASKPARHRAGISTGPGAAGRASSSRARNSAPPMRPPVQRRNDGLAPSHPAAPARVEQDPLTAGLMKASAEFQKPGSSMADIARASGLAEETLGRYFTQEGPTTKGWDHINRCNESVRGAIVFHVGCGLESRAVFRREQAQPEATVPPVQALPSPSPSIAIPDSDWGGWDFDPSVLHDEVTGPARSAQGEAPDSMYQGLPSLGWSYGGQPYAPPTPYSEVMGPARTPEREATDSAWYGIGSLSEGRFDAMTPGVYEDVTGPARSPQPEATDSAWHGVPSLSGSLFDLNTPYEVGVTGPARSPQPEATDSAWRGVPSLSGSLFDLNSPYDDVTGPARSPEPSSLSSSVAYHGAAAAGPYDAGTPYASTSSHPAYGQPSWDGAVVTRSAPEIVDVESYQPRRPEQPRVSVAQRLRGNAWLGDDDIMNYTQLMIHRLGESLGPGGHDVINQRLSIADSQQVHTLRMGDAASRASVLRHLTGAILLLPVHRTTDGHRFDHWSLLVVNRASATPRAYHFDSMVPRRYVEVAHSMDAFRDQFEVAREVASALGVHELLGRPTALQEDGHSCGDHVLAGIKVLASRIVRSDGRISWNLSGIRPDRQEIIATLVQHEQFIEEANASGAPRQRMYMDAGPRRNRR